MVREAAVDLVGKFILHKQELIDKYYDMLLLRILVSTTLSHCYCYLGEYKKY
jgi:hypothetical protein